MSMDKYSRIRRYRNVLRLREEGMSFEAIAKRFGLSRQRMWQVHAEALDWSEKLPGAGKVGTGIRLVAQSGIHAGAQLDEAAKEPDQVGEPVEKGDGKPRRKRFVGFGRFRLDRQ
jgi:transcriptional regulator